MYSAVTDCLNYQCPIGSECKVCDTTGLPYCEYSCAIDNGGCRAEALCTEVPIRSPDPQECILTEINCKSIGNKEIIIQLIITCHRMYNYSGINYGFHIDW